MILDKLFIFPVVMIDGDNEEKKARTSDIIGNSDNEQDADMIMGEAECPYYDFLSITDRWLPSDESFQKALDGKFEACGVTFSQSGTFIVPWNKKKFKRELQKFIDGIPEKDRVMNGGHEIIEFIKND